jgi:hypothetical protein
MARYDTLFLEVAHSTDFNKVINAVETNEVVEGGEPSRGRNNPSPLRLFDPH